MKYYPIALIAGLLLSGCANHNGVSPKSYNEKDRVFESYVVEEFNQINKLKNKTMILDKRIDRVNKSDIFYQQIHGGK